MIWVILLTLLFITMFKIYYKRGSIITSFLFLIYALSFVATLILIVIYDEHVFIELNAIIYLLIFLTITFLSFQKVKRSDFINRKINTKLRKYICYFYSIALIPANIIFIYFIIKLFTTHDIATYRYQNEAGATSLLPRNIFITYVSHLSATFFIPLYFFFYELVHRGRQSYVMLNLFSSFSFILLVLNFAGRDGVMYWVIDFLLLYIIFKKNIPTDKRKAIKKYGILFITLALTPIIYITTKRFSLENENIIESFKPIISYLGQELGNFCESFKLEKIYDSSLFPGITKLLGVDQITTIDRYWDLRQQGLESQYNVFGFYVKDIIWSYGKTGGIMFTIIFSITSYCVSTFVKKNNRIISFIFLLILLHYPLMGVFYYRQNVGNMDLSYTIAIMGIWGLKKIVDFSKTRRS